MMRELSVEEVAAATKLPARVIASLEADEIADHSHALLVARACASAIGLDPEDTALRLEEELHRSLPPPRLPLWKRLWHGRPRSPTVWVIVAITVVACIALLFRRH